MQSPQPVISYGDLPTRCGITFWSEGNLLRMIIPPLRRISELPLGYKIGVPYLMVSITLPWIDALTSKRPIDLGSIMASIEFCIILLIILFFAARRLFASRLIELDESFLSIARMYGTKTFERRRWPRQRVGTVKRNASTGQLIIHVVGYTLVEVHIAKDPAVVDWVAEQITAALTKLPATPLGVLPGDDLPEPMHEGCAKSVLIGIACTLAGIGFVLLILGGEWRFLGCFPLFLAALPAGIALGMQDKQGNYF